MNKVYAQIGEFSEAISGNAHFAILLIENARSIVLDTSSMLGRSYDIGEITWINEFENFLGVVEEKAERYEENPYELINDINELVVKPAYDLQGSVWSGIFDTVDTMLIILDRHADNVIRIKDDLYKLIEALPTYLKDHVSASVMDAIHHVDQFFVKEYRPMMGKLQGAISVIERDSKRRDINFDGILERLKNPAQYLLEAEKLPRKERIKAYETYAHLAEVVYRQPVT